MKSLEEKKMDVERLLKLEKEYEHLLKPTLGIKKLTDTAILPNYQTSGAAGFDIHSIEDISIRPNEHTLVSTGLQLAIPEGFVGLLFPRSGNAVKQRINLINCVGVIDSDFRGELKVPLNNASTTEVTFEKGNRIAQMVIMPFVQVKLLELDNLDETERGSGGFGHSGI